MQPTENKSPKVLYVSDSLGTPIHPRGIFNFSLSLIDILKSLGFNVTLLVEGRPGFGVRNSDFRFINQQSSSALRIVQTAEVLRYFFQGKFIHWFRVGGDISKLPILGNILASFTRTLFQAWHFINVHTFSHKPVILENSRDHFSVLPAKIAHLKQIDQFMVGWKIYSNSMFGGVNGFAVTSIDASGFDLVVVDTPHYVQINGIDPSRILSVVHDVIPLNDPTMSEEWRSLFLHKVEATLRMNSTMVFVSQTTRDIYYDLFPQRKDGRHIVIYPSVRTELIKLTEQSTTLPRTDALSSLIGDAAANRIDRKLPIFVTATTDEPRKNVEVLIKAFRQLRSIANLVVVGEVKPDRYIGEADKQNIVFTGYTSDAVKNELIRLSSGLIFPSLSEGFGIPIVEAGVLRRPVICSRIRVFEEITHGNAIYFDPVDSNDLIDAVLQVLQDPETSERRTSEFYNFIKENFFQSAMSKRVRTILLAIGIQVREPSEVVMPDQIGP